ncbi:hypothetical protein PMG11_10443 [Penicillium brasilianum]|uniref:Uncharacterized protein n=1 Tax=Penicillium brasilianum TaxID=104259 RepID=A0A0F7TZ74_PENBI|nr:hypothetical protein PMG11_10443 [Penicillium brasilianum]
MDESRKHAFVNYDPSNHRPNRTQRREVSSYIGKHYRNRSAPAKRAQQAPDANGNQEMARPFLQPMTPSMEVQTQIVIRGSPSRVLDYKANHDPEAVGEEEIARPEIPHYSRPGIEHENGILLLRPVLECFVPAYPPEHREKVFDVLDLHIHFLAARLMHWGPGANPFVRCWVQMICADVALFDAVAAFTHGVRITALEDKVTPTATMLWHKARALKALQAKIATGAGTGTRPLTEHQAATWTSNETILSTFYLMEAAARFGYETEFRAHCQGLLRMMQMRGRVASGCLKDLFVLQAAGLVEGTEMASAIQNESEQTQHDSSSSVVGFSGMPVTIHSELRYPDLQPGTQFSGKLRMTINVLPKGFRELAMLGNLSIEFILLLEEQLKEAGDDTQTAERQTMGIRRARLLLTRSQNVVERLACLGMVAFLTRRTAQMQMFPEVAYIYKLGMMGRQMSAFGAEGKSCYGELRVWATLVGTEVAITAGANLKLRAGQLMRDVFLQEEWINDWADVEMIAKRHLWDENTLTAWRSHWMTYGKPGQLRELVKHE